MKTRDRPLYYSHTPSKLLSLENRVCSISLYPHSRTNNYHSPISNDRSKNKVVYLTEEAKVSFGSRNITEIYQPIGSY